MNPIQPSRAMNIKIELAGQTPKQLEKSIKGLDDGERKYLLNILRKVDQSVDSNMEVRIAQKLHLYTIKSENDPQMSKMNKIMANFKGERTRSSEVTKAVKSWENHLSTAEIVVMSKKMNEVKKDSFGRNLRDRQFSMTDNVTASHLRTLGLKPGASLSDAIEAYKSFKSDPDESNIEAKFSALESLHLDYDRFHPESNFEFANTKPRRPLPLPPLQYRSLSLQEKAHLEKFGIKEDATSSEIRAALKKPMMMAHTDRGGSTEAMQEIVDGPLVIGQNRQREEVAYQLKVAETRKPSPIELLGITPGQSRTEVLEAYSNKFKDKSLSTEEGNKLRSAMRELDRLYEERVKKDLRSRF